MIDLTDGHVQTRLKLVLRVVRRHPVYALINTVGLAVGMASFILILLFVREEFRFDRFHEHSDRLVRVASHYTDEAGTRSFARSYPAIAPGLLADFPEVTAAVRLQRWNAVVQSGDRQFNERQMFMADPSFFDLFSFPLLHGDPKKVLRTAESVVITESTSERYFGKDDPIGKELLLQDSLRLYVDGVVADPPAYSHIQFSMILPMQILRDSWKRGGRDLDSYWRAGTFYTYLLLTEDAARIKVSGGLDDFLLRRQGDQSASGVEYSLSLQPITDIHLNSDLRQEMGPNGSRTYTVAFLLIAILILVISAVNFVNLATARASKRAQEVGVRKAVGASKGQLVRQFLLEAVITSLLALGVALVIVSALLPQFNTLADSSIALLDSDNWWLIPGLVVFPVVVGLLAGAYPSLVLSSFEPGRVLKAGRTETRQSMGGLVRRSLVGFQFFLSVGIMSCSVVAWQQTQFMHKGDLGFDTQTLVLPYYWDGAVTERLSTLKSELLRLPEVTHVTASGDVPGRMFTSMSYWIEGMADQERGGINLLVVDPDFAETYGLEMASGRDFSITQSAALGESFILNETAVREIGLTPDEIIGKTFEMNTRGPVIGVVKDFHFEGLQAQLEPLVMTVWPDWFGYVSVGVSSSEVSEVISEVEAVWTSLLPHRPFEHFVLDQDFESQYRAEDRLGEVFGIFAFLSIFISCLGLLGLAAFASQQKTKEIGVRKVFGASVGRIIALMNKEFVVLAFVAGMASIPVTWMVMGNWLRAFAYRMELGPVPFFLSLAVVVVLGLATVSFHSIRAAIANPIESLRYE